MTEGFGELLGKALFCYIFHTLMYVFMTSLFLKGFFSDLEQKSGGLPSKLLKPAFVSHLC